MAIYDDTSNKTSQKEHRPDVGNEGATASDVQEHR